jgi:predicted RNA-binding Zn-ribbon protein involved in translation (DUF1610 family)
MDATGNITRAARNLITEHGRAAEKIAVARAINAAESNRAPAAITWRAVAAAVRRLQGAVPMPQIMIKCDKTGQAVSTGMITDQTTWRKLAANWKGAAFVCPACGAMHAWIKSDALLAARVG